MCGGSDEKGKEEDQEFSKRQPKTGCKKVIERIQAVIFFILAIYTIYSLFTALQQVTRKDLQLDDTPPSDYCVPMFDTIKGFKNNHSHNTYALYDYIAGTAVARICSNESRFYVEDKIGVEFVYDPWVVEGGCDVLNNPSHRASFIANCEPDNFETGQSTNCADLIYYGNHSNGMGVHWNHYLTKLTGNRTLPNGTRVAYGPCAMKVTRIQRIDNCTLNYVGAYRKVYSSVAIVLYLAVAVPFIMMAAQTYFLWRYASNYWPADQGWQLAFASRGVPGSMYMFYWICKEGDETGGHVRGEFPDVYLTFGVFIASIIQDTIEGVASPLVAILGCQLTRFPVNLILLVAKSLKLLYDTYDYLNNRNEEQEPGRLADQEKLWQEELKEKYHQEQKDFQEGKPPPPPPTMQEIMGPGGMQQQPNATQTVTVTGPAANYQATPGATSPGGYRNDAV